MRSAVRQHLPSVLVGSLFLAALVWACGGSSSDADPDAGGSSGTSGTSGTSGASGGGTSGGGTSGGGTSGGSGGLPDAATDAGPDGATTGGTSTEPGLKVAFIGDTGTGANFRAVLQLIKREGADLVLVQGDMNYAFLGPGSAWFSVIDSEINASAASAIPYFIAKGNHDVDWALGYAPGLKTRMATWGIPPENGDPTTTNYSVVYKGLKVVMVDDNETSPTRTDYVNARFAGDDHIWRICSWHKNQRDSNVGPKDDEMGWGIYEACRNHGAIVAQAHSHTYSRSKTLTNATAQTVDTTCSDPFELCLGPGRNFFFDSSLGGRDTRSLETSIASKPHFASSYTGGYGALFIEFHVGGDPKKAQGYFKTTDDVVVDPPASSGKTSFTIVRSP